MFDRVKMRQIGRKENEVKKTLSFLPSQFLDHVCMMNGDVIQHQDDEAVH